MIATEVTSADVKREKPPKGTGLRTVEGLELVKVEALKVLISLSGLTQRELAIRSGMTESQVSEYLSGETAIGRVAVVKFAHGLKVSPDLLATAEGISLDEVRKKVIGELEAKMEARAEIPYPTTIAPVTKPGKVEERPGLYPVTKEPQSEHLLGIARMVWVEIRDRVAAGPDAFFADDNVIGHTQIEEHLTRGDRKIHAVVAGGDSMEGMQISDGDVLIVDCYPCQKAGKIVVAWIREPVGDRLVVKLLARRKGKMWLVSKCLEGVTYPDIEVDGSVTIQGEVVKIQKSPPATSEDGETLRSVSRRKQHK